MANTYARDGYQLIERAIPQAVLEPFRAHISQQIGIHAQTLLDEGEIDDLYEGLPFGKRLAALHANFELRLRQWNEPAFGPALHALINHPAIAAALEPLLGPDISFNGDYHLRPKMPDSERTAFPLHQDSQYYGKASQHAHIITVWIPLVDVDEVNGCLFVIPGSNHWQLFDSARDENGNMRSFEDIEARGTPVPVPMRAGDILLFSNMTFHGSRVNRSDAVRWSTDIRYCRTRGTFVASEEELAGEEFMHDRLREHGRHAPMVVHGEGPRMSFEQWKGESEARRSRAQEQRSR